MPPPEEDDTRRGCRLVVLVKDYVIANVGYLLPGRERYEFADFSIVASRTGNPAEVAIKLAELRAERELQPDRLVVVADRPARGDAAPEVQGIDALDIGLPVMKVNLSDSEILVLPDFVLADDAYLGKSSGVPSSLNLPWSQELRDAEFCLYVGLNRSSSRIAWVSLCRPDVRPVAAHTGLQMPQPSSEDGAWTQIGEAILDLLSDPPGSVRAVLLGGDAAGMAGERAVSSLSARHRVLSGHEAGGIERRGRTPIRPLPEHAAMLGGLGLSLSQA